MTGEQPTLDLPIPQSRDVTTLMNIIDRAMTAPEFDLARMVGLLELKERWDASEAKRAFAAAKVAFKRNPPDILKNKHVSYNQTEYDHATHDEVTGKISERLAEYGFTHEWKMVQSQNSITVKCILTHVAGHQEEVELTSQHDGSGGKNSIQAISSANTYLQRYTLLAVTGMSTREMGINDDDGRGTEPAKPIPDGVKESLEAAAMQGGRVHLQNAFRELSEQTRALIVLHHNQWWTELKTVAGLRDAPIPNN